MNKPFLRFSYLVYSCLLSVAAFAQRNNQAPLQPFVAPDVKTVQLSVNNYLLSYPILDLKSSNGLLALEFDHLGSDLKDYIYTIRHCNSDWRPSDLLEGEYISGFTEDRILDFYNSFNTLRTYVHYSLKLPNANMRWAVSGNYVLEVYDNDNDRALVLRQRFSVVEASPWYVTPQFVRATSARKMDTHQEIDFTVNTKNMRIAYPNKEIKAYVLQNGRWDNAIGPLAPPFMRQDQLVFDLQDSIVFGGSKEWRFFNMRTFDIRGEGVRKIQQKPDNFVVNLQRDVNRAERPYVSMADINGRFIIENTTQGQSVRQCDYAEVIFWLDTPQELEEKEVYVYGALSNWELMPEFKMQYDKSIHAYVAYPLLKQGYYNYQYAVYDPITQEMDLATFEGDSFETENNYSFLIYYRPFGQRYERLMAIHNINSGWQR